LRRRSANSLDPLGRIDAKRVAYAARGALDNVRREKLGDAAEVPEVITVPPVNALDLDPRGGMASRQKADGFLESLAHIRRVHDAEEFALARGAVEGICR
jgi:hypothetical protein